MTETVNLKIPHLRPFSSQPEVVVDGALSKVDAALTEKRTTIEVGSSNEYTLSETDFARYFFFVIDDAGATDDIDLILPAAKRGLFAVINLSAFNVLVYADTQTTPAYLVVAGKTALLHCDGSDVRGAQNQVDAISGHLDSPGSGDVIQAKIFTETTFFPADLDGSRCEAGVAATLQSDVEIYKDAVLIWRFRFEAAGTVATAIAAADDVFFEAGEVMWVLAPNPSDPTLDEIVASIVGYRG